MHIFENINIMFIATLKKYAVNTTFNLHFFMLYNQTQLLHLVCWALLFYLRVCASMASMQDLISAGDPSHFLLAGGRQLHFPADQLLEWEVPANTSSMHSAKPLPMGLPAAGYDPKSTATVPPSKWERDREEGKRSSLLPSSLLLPLTARAR